MADWPEASLAQLVTSPVTYGVVQPGPEDPVGVAFVRGTDLRAGRVLIEQLRTITDGVSGQYSRTLLRGGELLISLVGNPGEPAVAPEVLSGANIARQVALVRLGAAVDPRFVSYFLQSPEGRSRTASLTYGSVQQVINLRDLKGLQVPIPPPAVQQGIVEVLEALDDKIDANAGLVRKCGELGSALFRNVADTRQSLSDVALVTMGQSPPSDTYNEQGDGLPFYQGTRDFGSRHPSRRVWCSAPTRLAEPQNVLVSVRAPVGAVNVATETCAIGRGVAAVSGNYPSTLYQALAADIEVWRPYESEGTVFGSINRQQLSMLKVPWVQKSRLPELEAQLSALDARLAAAVRESTVLAALRDALLPPLISGELRVRDAESLVGEAV